jgi:hypothetical protein
MGAILDLVQLAATPLGAVVTIAVAAGLYFFGRWVLTD